MGIRILPNVHALNTYTQCIQRDQNWSLTSLQQRLLKHARYYWLVLAQGHLSRRQFGGFGGHQASHVMNNISRAGSNGGAPGGCCACQRAIACSFDSPGLSNTLMRRLLPCAMLSIFSSLPLMLLVVIR